MTWKLVWMLAITSASGMIFRDGPSPAANTETAPTGAYLDSGWQHQLRYQGFHATMISPKHFITANHVGASGTEVSQSVIFNGVESRFYGVKTPSRRIGNTDLRIFEIWETFEDYAELYTKTDESGEDAVIFGRGLGRGGEIAGKGWKWGSSATRKSRWGRNQIQGIGTSGGNDLLFFGFSDVMGEDEVMLTNGDSGGGWFIKDAGVWKLAAVTFSVDAFYSDAVVPADSNRFGGAFYNAENIFFGSDAGGWNLIADIPGNSFDDEFYLETHAYASRISSHIPAIESLIQSGFDWAEATNEERFLGWLGDFGVISLTGAGDDADSDGLTNLEEYLAESDPAAEGDTQRPMVVELLSDGTHRITLVESLDLAGRGLTTLLESSSDLASWEPAAGFSEESNVRNSPAGVRTRILEASPGGSAPLFYRLKITLD